MAREEGRIFPVLLRIVLLGWMVVTSGLSVENPATGGTVPFGADVVVESSTVKVVTK